MRKPFFLSLFTLLFLSFNNFAQDAILTSTSRVDWTKKQFISSVTFNIEKTQLSLPSERNAATEIMHRNIPVLIKEPLLSLYVDNSNQLGDLILNNTIKLTELTDIIYKGKMTPAVFKDRKLLLNTSNTININFLSKPLVVQKTPYELTQPINTVSTRKYSGIVIDARGQLPVHGEFVESKVFPCLLPKIWNEDMDIIFERDMVEYNFAKENGIILYSAEEKTDEYTKRVGYDPLYIKASKVYGRYRTDPVITVEDALKIISLSDNRKLLKEGKVVLLLDKDELVKDVSSPIKDEGYYETYNTIRTELTNDTYELSPDIVYKERTPDINVDNGPNGITISVVNLKFVPDSSELLPEEKMRIVTIAETLKKAIAGSSDYTILVEGHTADVGKPVGQMNLSIERTKAIMNLLIAQGLPQNIFTYKGYGGTVPAASNETEEGRKQNRRVIITVQPKTTLIQGIDNY